MKKNIIRLLVSCYFMLCFVSTAPALETFQIDPLHSFIVYHINHLGYSDQTGKWSAKGKIEFDEKQPQKSKVNVTVDVANMVTGIDELNKHLQGELFFHTAKYPVATFVSNNIVLTGKNSAKITGLLTLRGVTKPITLTVTLNRNALSPINNKMTMGFSGTTQLKRSDFGMSTLAPALGDNVKLDIQVEANQPPRGVSHAMG